MSTENQEHRHHHQQHQHPIVAVDGHIETGRNFDVEIKLPGDNRDSVYGVIKDANGDPVEDAVVKLVEIRRGERRPVSHTFTNEAGEFVFGPLCPTRHYEILFWADDTKHIKICKEFERQGGCLTGTRLTCNRPPHPGPGPRPRPCREGMGCEIDV
ncbi:MAG: carboxypeptidase-like regulatory domain-containing protein [Oscillospiraceae bacterium]|nr:carboxypeptidase-like regulatory domain-containing protein [Oscillospiraceae bacterium]